MLLDYWWVDV